MKRHLGALLIPTFLMGISGASDAQQPGQSPGDTLGPGVSKEQAAPDTLTGAQATLAPADTAAQPAPPPAPPKPPVTPANGRAIRVEGQVQVASNTSSVDSVVTWDAELRRMRITALADVTDRLSASIMADFGTDRAIVQDAFLDVKTTPTSPLSFRVGQFKVPFNGIQLVSDKQGLMVERGARIRGFRGTSTSTFVQDQRFSDRGRGAMATYKPGRLSFQLGGFLGSGQASDNNAGKELAARIEWSALRLPSKYSKPLILAVGAVTNGYYGSPRDTLRVVGADSIRIGDPQYATAWEGFVEYGKYQNPGVHLAANVIGGQNPLVFTSEGDGSVNFEKFIGVEGWAEFLVPIESRFMSGIAPAFRADRFDPNTAADDDTFVLITPGLNLYFGPTFRWQLNWDFIDPQAEALDGESSFRVQTQLLF